MQLIPFAIFTRIKMENWTTTSDVSTRRYRRELSVRISELNSEENEAGNGVYTKKFIKDKGIICEYMGPHIENDAYAMQLIRCRMYSVSHGGITICGLNEADGEPSCVAAVINDPLDDERCNVKLQWKNGRCYIVAMRDIEEGEELYLAYGGGYWISDHHPRHLLEQARANYTQAEFTNAWIELFERLDMDVDQEDAVELEVQEDMNEVQDMIIIDLTHEIIDLTDDIIDLTMEEEGESG